MDFRPFSPAMGGKENLIVGRLGNRILGSRVLVIVVRKIYLAGGRLAIEVVSRRLNVVGCRL